MQNHFIAKQAACVKQNFCYFHRILTTLTALVLILLLQIPALSFAASNQEKNKSSDLSRFLTFEIEGVSLSTPLEDIPTILENRGYTQTGNNTYIKQLQVPGQRKSVFRIEVEDDATLRQIQYIRGESGGRVKSPGVQERPIPPNEKILAQALYEIVCTNATADLQATRSCKPLKESHIQFGQDTYVKVNNQIAAQLSATAANTTIGLKHFK